MTIHLSKNFLKSYRKLLKKNPQLKTKIAGKLSLFKTNPGHPSLNLHKLQGKMVTDWTIAIAQNLRVIFTYVDDGILLVDIGKHEEVYRK